MSDKGHEGHSSDHEAGKGHEPTEPTVVEAEVQPTPEPESKTVQVADTHAEQNVDSEHEQKQTFTVSEKAEAPEWLIKSLRGGIVSVVLAGGFAIVTFVSGGTALIPAALIGAGLGVAGTLAAFLDKPAKYIKNLLKLS